VVVRFIGGGNRSIRRKPPTWRRTDNIMAIKRKNEAKDRQYNDHKKEK
jgi:hypothetical protein